MTNKEYFLKEGVSVEEFITAFIKKENISINSLEVDQINHFLKSEVTPTLTEDERVILRNLPREWKYINRIDGRVCIKQELEDSTNLGINYLFPDLFQFIKERREIWY